ncbi:prepilin-type N-terminal cleavage/methylation domain-containing protein [bacterium]|nr:prepilin-type N-terminal cleavage/methylation domain-containing protein [bacterium]
MTIQTKDHSKPIFSLSHFHTSKGFTLVELLIAILILGGGIFLLLTMFTTGLKGVISNQARTQATNLAQDLMDEILGKNWDEKTDGTGSTTLGRENGENTTNRSAWDDVDDYLTLSSGEKPPRDALNNQLTLYDDFTRYVSVWYIDPVFAESATSTGLKRISVWVSHSDISDVVITGLRTKSIY